MHAYARNKKEAYQRARVVDELLDFLKEALHKLAALGKPLGEERMRVDLHQLYCFARACMRLHRRVYVHLSIVFRLARMHAHS